MFKYFSIFLLILSVLGCGSGDTKQPDKKAQLPQKDSLATAKHFPEGSPISDSVINGFVHANAKYGKFAPLLKDFYRKRAYAYVWLNRNGIAPRANTFINMAGEISEKKVMSYDSLHNAYLLLLRDTVEGSLRDTIRSLELRLTADFFTFADNEWTGNDQTMVQKVEWFIPKKTLDYEAILDTLLGNNKAAFKPPVYRQYELLKSYLDKYRKIELNGGWAVINLSEEKYKRGDTASVLSAVKKRLMVTGDYKATDTSMVFNESLTEAVKNFQARYGQSQDGIVSREFVNEMNTPIHKRIEQIIINIERCRWVPAALTGDYLVVNIPEFKLHVYDGNQYLWNMNVVLGRATDRTVIFNGNLKYIVFNPYWNVPMSIFSKEILPKIRADKTYFNSEELEIVKNSVPEMSIDPESIDWNNPEEYFMAYTIRQKPGKKNALGSMKFLFPNEYNIYLHDTPSKSLFERSSRSFSHGCIRLAEPEKLALFLLQKDKDWNENSIKKALEPGKEKYVTLKEGVPVFIAYFTAWVDRQGRLNFRDDIYGHDAKMAKLIFIKPRI